MELATASKSVETRSIPVRAIAIAVIYSIYPFAGFLNANRSDGATPGALLPYTLIILLPSLALLLVVHLRRGEQAAARAAVVLAAAVFLLFSYSNLGRAMSKAGISSHQIVLWVLVFVVGVAVTYVLSKYEIAALYVLVAGALLTALPVVQYVAYRADASSENAEAGLAPLPGGRLVERPNVYFFLLDGYGRADQLSRVLGYDNGPFVKALERRGFKVPPGATAAYPQTRPSLTSTLRASYLFQRGGGTISDVEPLHRTMQGDSPTVRRFKQAGYRYVHVPNGKWSGTACSGEEDLCVEPLHPPGFLNKLDELDWALLDTTPLAWAARKFGHNLSGPYAEPGHAVKEIRREGTRSPFFAFAHIINPHPPYRYKADCSRREVRDSSLQGWKVASKPLYVASMRCANAQITAAADSIIAREPSAIIVVAGDHGPGFGVPLSSGLSRWSRNDLRERFGILLAIRLPRRCRDWVGRNTAAVNTFRIVVGCLTHRRPRLLPSKTFMLPYRQTKVEPIRAQRLAARD